MSCLIISIIVLILDQLSKYIIEINLYKKSIDIIENVFSITYVENYGAAWGILSNNNWIILILTPLLIGLIVWYLYKISKNKLEYIAGGLVIGGAIGNYLDRIVRGYVVDFLDFKILGYNYPIFNIADTFIVVGVFLLLILTFRKEQNRDSRN